MNKLNELFYDAKYLRKAIHNLNTLVVYPDVEINVTTNIDDTVTFKAILSLPNDEILREEITVNVEVLQYEGLIKHFKKDLLNKIGAKYINRAYEFRINNENVAKNYQVNGLSKILKKYERECEE